MNRTFLSLGLLVALGGLSACGDGQPFQFGAEDGAGDGGGTDPTADSIVPEEISRNLTAIEGGPADPTVDVTVGGIDGAPAPVTFTRNAALDLPGYVAYSYQDDPLDRFFVAMVQVSEDGSVYGASVISGGQFTEYFGGVYYDQVRPYTPGSNQVTFAGEYVGLTNINYDGDQLLDIPPGTPDLPDLPGQPMRINGNIFLNVNFDGDGINGDVTDRTLMDTGQLLPDINLLNTTIAEDGTFSGTVELDDKQNVGTYAGAFGGTGATSVAGGLFLDGDWWDEIDAENEIGLFVLNVCGGPGEAPVCSAVEPNF